MNKLTMSIKKLNHNMDTLTLNNFTRYLISDNITIKSLVFPKEVFKIEVVVLEKKSLTCHTIINIENINGTLKIINEEETNTSINLGIKANLNNELSIINELVGSHIKSSIKIRMIGEKNSHTTLKTTGIILKDTHKNIFLEDIKYLVSETSYMNCMPNLFIESNDVEANHNVSMGCISEEELFYLKSKGMEEKEAYDLIRKCFLKSMLGGENNESV